MNADHATFSAVFRGTGVSPVSSSSVPQHGLDGRATNQSILKRTLYLCSSVFICGSLLLGCQDNKREKQATRALRDYFDGDYPRAIARLDKLSHKTDENYVLNNLRLGSIALSAYDLDEAEGAFLRAWEIINAGGVNSGGRDVAAVWVSEKLKIWKGEPYERALASFYLGVVYYMRHDYDNARAAFENSLFKLRDYADAKDEKRGYTEQESTFVVAHIMLGRCYQHLNRPDLAQMNFEQAAKLQPRLANLANETLNKEANVLLVVDFGYAPRKVEGFDSSQIAFRPEPGEIAPVPLPRVEVNGQDYAIGDVAVPAIDTVRMAQDRKWQSIDTIRTVKAGVGVGLMAAGAGYGVYKGANRDLRGEDVAIAAGLIAAGALLKASSDADLRVWELAPRSIFLIPLKLPPGKHDITVSFPQADDLHQTWHNLDVPADAEATYYYRMNRWQTGPFTWPPQPIPIVDEPAVKTKK